MGHQHDVLVLGGAGVDTVVYVPQLPLPFADTYVVPAVQTRAGQTGDGVAIGLAALGLRVHHLDVVGRDPEGDLVRALHDSRGVPFTAVPSDMGTKRAVNLVDPGGRRLSLYDGSRTSDEDRFPESLVTALAARARHVHVSITQPCQHALPVLAGLGVSLSTDLHDWDGIDSYHEQYAYQVDMVFLSATALTDPELTLRKIVANGRAHTVVATDGERGGYLLRRGEGVVRRFPAAPLPGPAVDSNGAGDAFVSGFLYGHLAGQSVQECVRCATVAGAHACTVSSAEIDPIGALTLSERAASWAPPFTDAGSRENSR